MKRKNRKASIAFILILLLFLNMISVQAAVIPPTEPEQIVLSLTGDSSEMAVAWCDAGSLSGSLVVYGTDSGLSGAATTAAIETISVSGLQYYEALMTGLSSGQQYYYQVGTPDRMSDVKSFITSDGEDEYKFIYLGDVQFNSSSTMIPEFEAWSSLVQSAYNRTSPVAFILQGGDMVNQGQDPEEWQALLTRAESTLSEVPFLSVPGNHESNDESTGKPLLWSQIFDLPKNGPSGFEEEFYSFDYGDSHILCLNSNLYSNEQLDAGAMDEEDFDRIKSWIADDLSSTDKTWKIAFFHHPPYVVVDDPVSEEVLNEWVPVFEDNGVSLVFCGHQHIYMRTFPMFDRERDDNGGITYIQGNSGSKFYPEADVSYDACMIEDTSTYQTVSIASDGITVETYDVAGEILDSVVVTEPIAAGNTISLSYDSSAATVTAPALEISGSSVTVNVSDLSADKKVYSVSVEDRNGKSYPVTTLTTDSSYSFIMPNRSVTVEVLFEDRTGGGGTEDTYYTYTLDTNDDPIWTMTAASSGIAEGDKIRAGATVTVTVTRENEAYGASLDGLDVKRGGSSVPVTTVSTTKGFYGKTKGGKYQFTMPEGSVTVSPDVTYESLKVYAREKATDSYALKETFNRQEMESLSDSKGYYTGYDSLPAAVIGKADEYVDLEALLIECGIELTHDSSILLSSLDGASRTFTYDELYGTTRYYYPNLSSGSSSGKKTIEPMLVIKGYQSRYINLPDEGSIDDMASDTMAAYRFAFGQTQQDFNNGTPSLDCVTVRDFLKWTNSIKVTGYKAPEEEPDIPEGGGGISVEAEAVVDTAGKATVTLEISAVKESLDKAVETAGTADTVPQINIDVPMETGLKSVEVIIPGNLLKELTAPEKLRVSISTPFGSMILDAETLRAIADANSGEDIKIEINPVDAQTIQNSDGRELTETLVSVIITAGKEKVTEFGGGNMKIRIPFTPDPDKKIKGYYVVWLTDDGKTRRMPGAFYDEAGKAMEFDTGHLSAFAVAYTSNTAVNVFTDVKESAWYIPYASFVTENGYFQGTSDTTFGPDAAMTRAMLVTVLGRISDVNTEGYLKTVFSDVSPAGWYGPYVQWAHDNGIVSGVGDGRFAPDQPITREQLSVILSNYDQWKNLSGSAEPDTVTSNGTLTYGDAGRISKWASEGVAFCVAKGWISGYPDGTFRPDKSATRAEVAKMLSSICE